jgi:cytoskeletal protein CcmA (bactofilin family)/ribosomal protein S27E
VAKPLPAKVSVECPHCGFKQMDYAAAKSTLCRQCGRHFSPSAPKPALKLRSKEEAPPRREASILQKLESLWNRQRSSVVECFECKRKHEVSGAATSTICPACSAYIDLRDYKIATSFSRTIRTRGDVHLMPKGDIGSTGVICHSALVEGKLRGNLHCTGTATINFVGKLPGRLSAEHLVVTRKADVQCFRQVTAGSVEIKGRMSAEIVAGGPVIINKNASLEGNVTARAMTVEKGGIFCGTLVIGHTDLTQAELLPEQKPAMSHTIESGIASAAAHPLPAA